MDFELLRRIMSEDLVHLEINTYEKRVSGTLRLAEDYIKTLKYCTSERISNSEVAFYYRNQLFGALSGQVPSTSDSKGIKLCKDKMRTEKLLNENGLRTTESILLNEEDYLKGLGIIKSSNVPLVLKPYNLYAGKGVTLNVNEKNFDFAWNLAKKEYESNNKIFKVLVQPLLKGVESRFLIVEGKFNSAILRVPANILGDGKNSIRDLITQKNKERVSNPHLSKLEIKISETIHHNLKINNRTLDTIPARDEIIFLHQSSNISLGGDSYEISHLIGNNLIKMAERAVEVIPGIHTAGVDIMFENLNDINANILEINPGANLRMHHYPFKGEAKTPVHDLIDSLLENYKN